jgi:hypothetical protein
MGVLGFVLEHLTAIEGTLRDWNRSKRRCLFMIIFSPVAISAIFWYTAIWIAWVKTETISWNGVQNL